MTAYGNGKDIVIGVRGMRMLDPNDYLTDAELAQNNLAETPKYQSAKGFVNDVILGFPESAIYLSGHSLGGAIATQLKRDFPQIKFVIEFNPAFQPKDVFASPPGILRIYQSKDWIYNLLQGRLIANRVVDSGVRTPFQAHSIESFRAMYSPVKNTGDVLGFAD
jgi:alpha-beta hydrolase superfamily lysophospholipase